MYYLIYVSTATKALHEEQLISLLESCRENNLKQKVTGMLLYKNGHFMQMLEGDEKTVKSLYEKICCDKRHHGQYLVMTGNTEQRAFPDWSMVFNASWAERSWDWVGLT